MQNMYILITININFVRYRSFSGRKKLSIDWATVFKAFDMGKMKLFSEIRGIFLPDVYTWFFNRPDHCMKVATGDRKIPTITSQKTLIFGHLQSEFFFQFLRIAKSIQNPIFTPLVLIHNTNKRRKHYVSYSDLVC